GRRLGAVDLLEHVGRQAANAVEIVHGFSSLAWGAVHPLQDGCAGAPCITGSPPEKGRLIHELQVGRGLWLRNEAVCGFLLLRRLLLRRLGLWLLGNLLLGPLL